MRVGPLSDDKIIDLLTKYFVPVWLSNDHFQLAAPSDAEQSEVMRIYRERERRHLATGTVCVVVLAPDASVAATLRLHQAADPEILGPFLQKIVDDGKLNPRSAEAIRATTAASPPLAKPRTEGGMVLHVLTRFADMKPNRGVSQDWLEWTPAEWSAFAPAKDAAVRAVQTVPKETAYNLFRRLYPPWATWDPRKCQVVGGTLTTAVVAVEGGEIRLRLEGEGEMRVPVGDDPVGGKITVRLVGAARYDTARRAFTSFALVSDRAEFLRYWKGAPLPAKMMVGVEMEP